MFACNWQLPLAAALAVLTGLNAIATAAVGADVTEIRNETLAVAWDAQREVPRALVSRNVPVPAIPNVNTYTYASPNSGTEATLERTIAQRIASTMLLLPQPLGPTMPLIPAEKSMTVLSRKDLNPMISSRLSFIPSPCFCRSDEASSCFRRSADASSRFLSLYQSTPTL